MFEETRQSCLLSPCQMLGTAFPTWPSFTSLCAAAVPFPFTALPTVYWTKLHRLALDWTISIELKKVTLTPDQTFSKVPRLQKSASPINTSSVNFKLHVVGLLHWAQRVGQWFALMHDQGGAAVPCLILVMPSNITALEGQCRQYQPFRLILTVHAP